VPLEPLEHGLPVLGGVGGGVLVGVVVLGQRDQGPVPGRRERLGDAVVVLRDVVGASHRGEMRGFYLNVAVGAVTLLLARRVVPESRLRDARRRYDSLGAVTVTGAWCSWRTPSRRRPPSDGQPPGPLAMLAAAAVPLTDLAARLAFG